MTTRCTSPACPVHVGSALQCRLCGRFRASEAQLALDFIMMENAKEALRNKLEIAEAALRRFGVCMTCLYGAPDYYFGCTDCMNTGFEHGESPAEIERREILERCEFVANEYVGVAVFGVDTVRQIINARGK
jgi:hypothetical protein